MTYYEEFCIPSSATPDEIRQAHRRLVKILHPDLQPEEIPRQLAQIQTRRINAIAQILLDPVRRQGYENGLQRAAAISRSSRFRLTPGLAITGICVLASLWLLQSGPVQSGPTTPHSKPPQAAAPRPGAPTPKSNGVAQSSTRKEGSVNAQPSVRVGSNQSAANRELSGDRESSAHPTQVDRIDFSKPDSDNIRQPQVRAAVEPIQIADKRPPTAQAAPDDQNPFVGTWIYLPAPPTEEGKKLYRPEYIEMRIRNIGGVIEGQYRARYHVPDRPLSPNVGFHFAGQPGTGSTAFRWSGTNGVAGKVELKLMTANSIQVDWRVTELAESADLVSGTAILTRVQ